MSAAPATTTLLTFGETMGLISARRIGTLDVAREASIGIGGAETNVAIGVARLGQTVTWIGRIGNDAVGDLIEKRLNAEGIATIAIRDGSFTGLMMRHTRAGTAVHVDYHRRGSAASRLTPSDIPRVADFERRDPARHRDHPGAQPDRPRDRAGQYLGRHLLRRHGQR